MSLSRSLLFGSLFILALSTVAMADDLDPGITIKQSGDPLAVNPNIDLVQANGDTDPLSFEFFNNFNEIIDGFTFSTHVDPGFTGPLTCASGYFTSCQVIYSPTDPSGFLEYIFSGVLTPSSFINCCSDTQMEGIAPGGTFTVTLTGFTVASGLYTTDVAGALGGPQPFTNTVEVIPEPTTIASLLLGAFLLLAGLGYRSFRQGSFSHGTLRATKFMAVLMLGAAALSADNIFYEVNQSIGTTGTVTGFIETNGFMGTILGATFPSPILDWNLELSDGTTNVDLIGPGEAGTNSALLIFGADLSATPNALLFNYSATDTGAVLFEDTAVGSELPFWCPSGTSGGSGANSCLGAPFPSGESMETSGALQFTALTGLQAIATIPEPSAIAFAGLALLGIVLLRRRLVRAVAR